MPNYAVLYHSQLPAGDRISGFPDNWPSRVQDIGDQQSLPPEYSGWNLLSNSQLTALRASLEPTVNTITSNRKLAARISGRINDELQRRLRAAAGRPWFQDKLASLISEAVRLIEKRDRTGTLTTQESNRLTTIGSILSTHQTLVLKADALLDAWNSGQTPDIYADANWQ